MDSEYERLNEWKLTQYEQTTDNQLLSYVNQV